MVGWWGGGGGGGGHQMFFLIYYSPGAGLSSDCCFAWIVEGVSFRVAGLARPVKYLNDFTPLKTHNPD